MAIATLIAVFTGCFLLASGGVGAPSWLRCIIVAGYLLSALFYEFCAFACDAPHWLSSMPVIGCMNIVSGSLIFWVPLNMVPSSAMMGFGCRCVLLEHKKYAEEQERLPRNTANERWQT